MAKKSQMYTYMDICPFSFPLPQKLSIGLLVCHPFPNKFSISSYCDLGPVLGRGDPGWLEPFQSLSFITLFTCSFSTSQYPQEAILASILRPEDGATCHMYTVRCYNATLFIVYFSSVTQVSQGQGAYQLRFLWGVQRAQQEIWPQVGGSE